MNSEIKRTYTTERGRMIRMVYFHRTVQEFLFRGIFYGFAEIKIFNRWIVLKRKKTSETPEIVLKIDMESDYEKIESTYFKPIVEIHRRISGAWEFDVSLWIQDIDFEGIINFDSLKGLKKN